jgi:hypothetical protein
MTCCVQAHLDVAPRALCQGDTATIKTRIRGSSQFFLTTGVKTTDPVVVANSPDTIRLKILAKRFGREIASSPTEIIVYPNTFTRTVVGRTKPLGRDSVMTSLVVPEAESGPRIRIYEIFSDSKRPLRIAHNGLTTELSRDGSPSQALEGQSINGEWVLASPLLQGEAMGDPQHPPPRSLSAAIIASCKNK